MSKTATQPAPDDGAAEVMEAGRPAPSRAKSWSGPHAINIRVTIPLFAVGSYYVTFLAGRERRGSERLKEERVKHPLLTSANLIFLFIVGFIVGGAGWIVLHALALWILGLNDV